MSVISKRMGLWNSEILIAQPSQLALGVYNRDTVT